MDRRLVAVLSGSGPQRLFKYFGGTDPRLSGGTYSGASVKTYVDSAGVVQYAPMNLCLQSESLATGATWVPQGTGTTTNGGNTAAGVNLATVNDTSAANAYEIRNTPTFTGDGVKAVSFFIAQGTSTVSSFGVRDLTGAAWRLLFSVTWSGGAPVVSFTGGGAGTLLQTVAYAGGVYRLLFATTTITAANNNYFTVFPAQTLAGDNTLTGTVFCGGVQIEDNPVPTTYQRTTTTAVYAPRYAHYVNGQGPTLLLEGSRQNKIIQSQDIATSWVPGNVSISTAITAPDGTTTAKGIIATAAAAAHSLQSTGMAITAADTVTYTFFGKAGTENTVDAYIVGTGRYAGKKFNLATGAITASDLAPSTYSVVSSSMTLIGSYYRCQLTVLTATDTTVTATLYPRGANAWTGDGSSTTITAWGHQFEIASFPSSYIPTTASAVTRAADSLSFGFAANPQAMTVYSSYYDGGNESVVAPTLWAIGGTTNEAFYLLGAQPRNSTSHKTGATVTSTPAAPAVALGDLSETRSVFQTDGSVIGGQSINSGAEVVGSTSAANTFGSAFSSATLTIGSGGAGNVSFMALKSFKIAAGVQQLATMRAA